MILDYIQTDYKKNLSEKDKCFFWEVMKIAYIVDLMEFSDFQKRKKISSHLRKEKSERYACVTLLYSFI